MQFGETSIGRIVNVTIPSPETFIIVLLMIIFVDVSLHG